MKVQKFDFEFSHAGKTFKASCQKFQVEGFHHYPMLRVAVERRKGNSDIYIFYEINTPKQRYFWYDLPGFQQRIAKSIEKALVEYDKPGIH